LTLNEEGGEEFLYLTDHTLHQVYKTTLDGQVLMTIDAPLDAEGYKEISQFQPTETAIDSQGRIYVADGYGAQYISVFSPKGELIQVFGGPDSFENAHGICIDTRSTEPTLLISARAQNALKRYSMDGSLLNEIPLPGAMINRAVVKGDHVYLSVLKSGPAMRPESGFILIMDKNDKLVSCPFGSEPSVHTEDGVSLHQTIQLLKHPHDVCVDRNENLIVPQWNAGGVYPIMLERV